MLYHQKQKKDSICILYTFQSICIPFTFDLLQTIKLIHDHKNNKRHPRTEEDIRKSIKFSPLAVRIEKKKRRVRLGRQGFEVTANEKESKPHPRVQVLIFMYNIIQRLQMQT